MPSPTVASPQPEDLTDLHTTLLHWYDHHGRDLPMRADGVSPWNTLVFEVMSQQTPIPRVQPRWLEWTARWPGPAEVAAATRAEVLLAWDRLGYPSRALRLKECAEVVTEDLGGELPADLDALLALPGVGPYTASAVASFSFHVRVPVLDTNVRRVLGRLLEGRELPRAAAPTRAERGRAATVLPPDGAEAAAWNLALMELGALVCTSRSPRCEECPLARECRWRAAGFPANAPARRGQAWAGTDRQARGRVMALLRERHDVRDGARGATREEALRAAALPGAEEGQAPRVVEALLRDGLVELDPRTGLLTLPS